MNPYSPPLAGETQNALSPPQLTWRGILLLLAVGTLGGLLLGTATNCINGAVSPQFFDDHILIWENAESLWLASVVQGALEGAQFGFGYALVFSVLIAWLSGRQCHLATALKYTAVAFALAVLFWVFGGVCGLVFAWLFPDDCPTRYFGWHSSFQSLARYAWVRGSYWGITRGGVLVVLATNLHFASRWQRFRRSDQSTNL